jgi:protein-tyrosine phosphatase
VYARDAPSSPRETATPADPAILVSSVPNFRDAGGPTTAAGRPVRTGVLYRSAALDTLDDAGEVEFGRLGIRTIYDFRTETERAARPDRVPPGVDHVTADVLGSLAEHNPRKIMRLLEDPALAREAFGNGKGKAMFVGQYREFIALESARSAYGRLFADLTDARRRPALIHCTGGKDRTGWAVAALQLWLGVPEDAVMADFMVSNERLAAGFRPFFAEFEARGGDAEIVESFLWVGPEYLGAALDEMNRRYGTIERYFSEGLRLDADTQHALRAVFLA